jgi:hypothetical protein
MQELELEYTSENSIIDMTGPNLSEVDLFDKEDKLQNDQSQMDNRLNF